MNPDFDRRLRESLDAAPAGELLPGFDKDALWPRIAERAARRGPLRIALPWLTHAAAVAAGLLLAWAVLPVEGERAMRSAAVVHARAVSIATVEEAPRKVQHEIPLQGVANKEAVVESSTSGSEAGARGMKDRVRLNNKSHRGETTHPSAQPAIAAVLGVDSAMPRPSVLSQSQLSQSQVSKKEKAVMKQPASLVVHLLDVTGEGERQLRAPVEPVAGRGRSLLSRLLSRNKVPDLTGAAATDAVVMKPLLSR